MSITRYKHLVLHNLQRDLGIDLADDAETLRQIFNYWRTGYKVFFAVTAIYADHVA